MQKYISYLFFLFVILEIQAQDHWESLILSTDTFKYIALTSPQASDWYNPEFDDSTWQEAKGPIGFGDGDDITIIPYGVNSLYLRRTFEIADTSLISNLLLDIDYDDGFVLYLNGVEISRSENVTETIPSYNSPLSFDREAIMINGGQAERHMLDRKSLINGTNVLAAQIINIESYSSDLSGIIFLNAKIDSDTILYNPVPTWFEAPVKMTFTDSNLPIVIINTNGKTIIDDPKVVVNMRIINNDLGNRNYLTDSNSEYDGLVAIELHGESTLRCEKKSYRFETQDSIGENLNVSLLGMPEENDWILKGPYEDKSLMRNVFAYHIAELTERYASRTAFCELVIDSTYMGLYVFTEKLKIDKNRIDIAKLKPIDISGDELTGGYLFRIDKAETGDIPFSTGYSYNSAPLSYLYYDPSQEELTTEQKTYLQSYVSDFEKALTGTDFADPEQGYNKYINAGSFIDFIIGNEISMDVDNYRLSTYMYKEKDSKGGKLFAGPLWDKNRGFCNSYVFVWAQGPDNWGYSFTSLGENDEIYWFKRLFEDPYFENLFYTRWQTLRSNELSTANLLAYIDSIATAIDEAQIRNFQKWKILGIYVKPNAFYGETYAEDLQYFKTSLTDRLEWIDSNITGTMLNPSVTISSLSENEIRVELSDDIYNRRIFKNKNFSLIGAPDWLIIDTIIYESATEAIIKTKLDYEDATTSDLMISVMVKGKILNTYTDITSNAIELNINIPSSIATDNYNKLDIYIHNRILTIRCEQPDKLSEYVQVYTVLGQAVAQYPIEKQYLNRIDLNLNSGIYIVKTSVNGIPVTKKILVEY